MSVKIFSSSELSEYNGVNKDQLFLCCLGQIFDVTVSRDLYLKGAYKTFIGRDSSKAFCTGDFSEKGSIADVEDLDNSDLADISDWLRKFHSKYPFMGVLEGIYYTRDGEKTKLLVAIEKRMNRGIAERNESKL